MALFESRMSLVAGLLEGLRGGRVDSELKLCLRIWLAVGWYDVSPNVLLCSTWMPWLHLWSLGLLLLFILCCEQYYRGSGCDGFIDPTRLPWRLLWQLVGPARDWVVSPPHYSTHRQFHRTECRIYMNNDVGAIAHNNRWTFHGLMRLFHF